MSRSGPPQNEPLWGDLPLDEGPGPRDRSRPPDWALPAWDSLPEEETAAPRTHAGPLGGPPPAADARAAEPPAEEKQAAAPKSRPEPPGGFALGFWPSVRSRAPSATRCAAIRPCATCGWKARWAA